MKKEIINKYYFDGNYNCAETILRAANDTYSLGLTDDALKIIGGFGAGMGCGKTCGALCGSLAVISKLLIDTKAHETANFANNCGKLVDDFERELGSINCAVLKEKYFKADSTRCIKTVEKAAQVLESYINDNVKAKKDSGDVAL